MKEGRGNTKTVCHLVNWSCVWFNIEDHVTSIILTDIDLFSFLNYILPKKKKGICLLSEIDT